MPPNFASSAIVKYLYARPGTASYSGIASRNLRATTTRGTYQGTGILVTTTTGVASSSVRGTAVCAAASDDGAINAALIGARVLVRMRALSKAAVDRDSAASSLDRSASDFVTAAPQTGGVRDSATTTPAPPTASTSVIHISVRVRLP